MSWLADIFYYLVPFLILLGILVFVHELGHFIVARLCGVKVEEFSIGFGREIWGFKDKKGTRWKIALIPLGGFVKMFGDVDNRALYEAYIFLQDFYQRSSVFKQDFRTNPSLINFLKKQEKLKISNKITVENLQNKEK